MAKVTGAFSKLGHDSHYKIIKGFLFVLPSLTHHGVKTLKQPCGMSTRQGTGACCPQPTKGTILEWDAPAPGGPSHDCSPSQQLLCNLQEALNQTTLTKQSTIPNSQGAICDNTPVLVYATEFCLFVCLFNIHLLGPALWCSR